MDTKSINELITKVVDEKLESKITEHLEKGITAALDDLFGRYGDVTKVVKDKLKEIMIPHVEAYNYEEYIPKLDLILAEIVSNAAPEYKTMLENFQEFTADIGMKSFSTIKLSDIFKKYCEFVAEKVDTSELEVEYDDGPYYEAVEVTMETETSESGFSFENKHVTLQCEKDESLNVEFETWGSRGKSKQHLRLFGIQEIKGIRSMSSFDMFLLKLVQLHIDVEIDEEYMDEQVDPKAEPEATYE